MNTNLQQLLEQHIAQGGFTAGAVIAAKQGKIVLERYAAAPNQVSCQNTLWAIASISKVYAVATIMRLVEMGAITLNTLASAVIPRIHWRGARGNTLTTPSHTHFSRPLYLSLTSHLSASSHIHCRQRAI